MDHYAGLFGLPVEQIRYFEDLSLQQQDEVAYHFSAVDASKYIYAVKRDGHLVSIRHKRNYTYERTA